MLTYYRLQSMQFPMWKKYSYQKNNFPSKKKTFIIEKETSQNNNKKALDQCWRKNNLWNWSTVTADREYNAYL